MSVNRDEVFAEAKSLSWSREQQMFLSHHVRNARQIVMVSEDPDKIRAQGERLLALVRGIEERVEEDRT